MEFIVNVKYKHTPTQLNIHTNSTQLKQRTSESRHFHFVCIYTWCTLQEIISETSITINLWNAFEPKEPKREKKVKNPIGMECLLMSAKSRCFPFCLRLFSFSRTLSLFFCVNLLPILYRDYTFRLNDCFWTVYCRHTNIDDAMFYSRIFCIRFLFLYLLLSLSCSP